VDGLILFIYLSFVISNLILSLFADYFGKKTFLLAGTINLIVGLLIALLVPNIYIASVGIFVALFGNQWSYSMAMNFIS
jgi:hypothetical protein